MVVVKLLVLLEIALAVDGIVNQDEAERSTFDQWKESYRRVYATPSDELKAKKNLIGNLREIEAHNVRFKVGLETYSRGLWELSDLDFEEKSQVLAGAKINESLQVLKGPPKKLQSGPAEVNWVKLGRVHPVLNQGRCGSCFAFATIGTMEGVALKKGVKTRFSVQQIVDCDKLNYGCDGGDIMLGFRYAKANNIASADQYPYTAREGKCKQTTGDGGGSILSSVVRERLNGNENRLKDIVASYGPVAVAINAANSLTNYRSGVYQNKNCPKALNHAVLLCGYGYDRKTKLDYWLVKNSWGTSWGENGYVRMARNKGSLCGIATEVIYAT